MSANPEMINPYSLKPMSDRSAGIIQRLREIRSNARKDARSGHPGRRAEGQRAIRRAGQEIKVLYLQEINA